MSGDEYMWQSRLNADGSVTHWNMGDEPPPTTDEFIPADLVERVARACWDAHDGRVSGVAWEDGGAWRLRKYRNIAAAAIRAMRDAAPTHSRIVLNIDNRDRRGGSGLAAQPCGCDRHRGQHARCYAGCDMSGCRDLR